MDRGVIFSVTELSFSLTNGFHESTGSTEAPMATNRERTLAIIQASWPKAVSNSEIVARAAIRPHQQVYQITQQLMREGRVSGRQIGGDWMFRFLRNDAKPRASVG
jgi:hypothetical protein